MEKLFEGIFNLLSSIFNFEGNSEVAQLMEMLKEFFSKIGSAEK